jgi:hypothetical protein
MPARYLSLTDYQKDHVLYVVDNFAELEEKQAKRFTASALALW